MILNLKENPETLAHEYTSESTQYDMTVLDDWMIFKDDSILVLWMKVSSALEGLTHS